MARNTTLLGAALIVLGIAAYILTAAESITALIPMFFGLPLVALGQLGQKQEDKRKHYMHAAAGIALLGFLGTVGAIRFALYLVSVGPVHVDNPPAVIARSIMAVLCGIYLYYSVKSFRAARKAREEVTA